MGSNRAEPKCSYGSHEGNEFKVGAMVFIVQR